MIHLNDISQDNSINGVSIRGHGGPGQKIIKIKTMLSGILSAQKNPYLKIRVNAFLN